MTLSVPYLLAASFPTGILIGLTGIGGAALMTPLLILLFGFNPSVAIGTDLVYSMFTKVTGSWLHWKQGHVDLRLVGILASASLPAAVLGTLAMRSLHSSFRGEARLKTIIGVVLLIVAGISMVRSKKLIVPGAGIRVILVTLAYAGVAGFLVGLTSIGSGSLILPMILVVNRLPVVRAVGTDIFHAAILVAFSAALHMSIGAVNWVAVPWLLAGSMPGVLVARDSLRGSLSGACVS